MKERTINPIDAIIILSPLYSKNTTNIIVIITVQRNCFRRRIIETVVDKQYKVLYQGKAITIDTIASWLKNSNKIW